MLTREQIEVCLMGPDVWPNMLRYYEDVPLFNELCALALRALDTEADARLGKAVREAVGNISVDSLEQTLREEYEGRGTGVFPRMMLLAVTRALRAEVDR